MTHFGVPMHSNTCIKIHLDSNKSIKSDLQLGKLIIDNISTQEAENIKIGQLQVANAINIATISTVFNALIITFLSHGNELTRVNFLSIKQDITATLTLTLVAVAISSLFKRLFFVSINNCKINHIKHNRNDLDKIPMCSHFYGKLSVSFFLLSLGLILYRFKLNLDEVFIALNQINSFGYSLIESFVLLVVLAITSIGGVMFYSALLSRKSYFKMQVAQASNRDSIN